MNRKSNFGLIPAFLFMLTALYLMAGCGPTDKGGAESTVISGATILDGSGSPSYKGDILIEGDRIARIGRPGTITAGRSTRVIEADGLTACPGFIDVHSHDDLSITAHPEQLPKVMMGVTTVVGGNCGLGMAPFDGDKSVAFEGLDIKSLIPVEELRRETMGQWMNRVEELKPGTNMAFFVPHVLLRTQFLGPSRRAPRQNELEEMKTALRQAMEEGAIGMSTGLEYMPGTWTGQAEIIELLKVVGEYGGVYGTHLRNEGERMLESVKEAIATARAAGVSLQISHFKSVQPYYGVVRRGLALIDEANREGLTAHVDQYPYTASSTSLAAYLRWGYVKKFPESFLIVYSEAKPEVSGGRLDKIAAQMGLEAEAAAKALLPAAAVQFCMDEEDVRYVMRHPRVIVATDGLDKGENPHPRLFGSYPRVLSRYVRETNNLTLPEAVRKMTGLPAAAFKLEDRGLLRPGAFADLVIFDPDTIEDRATYADPRQYPAGIDYVLVNGKVVVSGGKYAGVRAGVVIRQS
jgi:N-acyl-D-aspartate/D-glutamate deacylase